MTAPVVIACPSLALDVTLAVDALVPGREHRASAVDARAGGKGVNVARALQTIGVPATVVGFTGGPVGAAVAEAAAAEGLRLHAVTTGAPTRVCATVATPDGVTPVYPRAPALAGGDWQRLADVVDALLAGPAGVLVVSGSPPPGVSADDVSALVRAAGARGWTVVADTSGAALLGVLEARADVVAPNAGEVAAALGMPADAGAPAPGDAGAGRLGAAARALLDAGARAAVVSGGADGALVATGAETRLLAPHAIRLRNPVGAGDCLTAGIAATLADGGDLMDAAAWGMALAAASCETDAGAALDPARARALLAVGRAGR